MQNTIFITGTSSGIGQSTVELFAAKGWDVIATMRRPQDHRHLFERYHNVTVLPLDVTDLEQVERTAQQVLDQFGKVDVVVNNAGYCLMGPTETSTMEQIKKQFDTNVFGVFAVTKAFIPHFRTQRRGTFINIASSSAQFNYPYIGAYGSSKWAVRGLTEALGIELAPFNIQVKAIYPGTHATKIFTKLDDGTVHDRQAFQAYKPFYRNFFSAQAGIPAVTSPENIAQEVWKAATQPYGPLHIISGGEARLFAFLKKILPERAFQQLQIRSILRPAAKTDIQFGKWLMGSKVGPLEVQIDPALLH